MEFISILNASNYLIACLSLISLWLYPYFKGLADMEMKYNTDSLKDNDTWQNKWKIDKDGNFVPRPTKGWYGLYHRLFRLAYHERSLFSATWKVATSDKWHKYDSLRNWCWGIIGSYVLYIIFDIYAVVWIIPLRLIILPLVFHFTYTWKILPGTQKYS